MMWILPAAVAVNGWALLHSPAAALVGAAMGTALGRLLCCGKRIRLITLTVCAVTLVILGRLALPGLRAAILAFAGGQGLRPRTVAILAGITSVCMTVWMQKGKLCVAAVALALAPAFIAAGQTGQTAPAWSAAYFLSLMLVLLTAPLQLARPDQARHLAQRSLIPVFLSAVLVLCLPGLVPGQRFRQELLSVGQRGLVEIFGATTDMGFLQRSTTVPLGKSPPAGGGAPILEITPKKGGVYYLRGQDYDIFTGRTWESDEARTEEFGGWGTPVDRVTIRVLGYGNYMLLPYYPAGGIVLRGGHVGLTLGDYSVDIYPEGSAMAPNRLGAYYRLDDDTRAWAAGFLQGASTPAAVAQLVRSSAVYDRNTPAMPEEEENFAIWFAEQSDRGYCTHFATLAVVLLRAAGIPSRYVTGFRVEATAGEKTSVTADCAHAWAEFYDFASGAWKILECTPASGSSTAVDEPIKKASLAQIMNICRWLPIFAFFVIYFQSKLRIFIRHLRMRRGSIQRQAWYLYNEAVLLSSLLEESPPEYLHALLQRAMYSQAGLESQELDSFYVYCRQCLRRLRRKRLPTRLRHRVRYAAY